MKRTLALGVLVVATCTSASWASDFNWNRFYVGFAGGGGWGDAQQTDNTPFNSGTYDVSGGILGAVAGRDWQLNQVVLGVAGDISWASIEGDTKGTKPNVGGTCIGSHCSAELEWLGTLRGRVGLGAYQRFLPYLTGGVAWGGVHGKEGIKASKPLGGDGTATRTGWTAGVGVDTRLNGNWTVGLEYLFVDLGEGDVFKSQLGSGKQKQDVSFQTSIVRASLVYEFGAQ